MSQSAVFNKPFAPSCEENKQIILESISPYLHQRREVLEIASGTGQHAIYFAERMPHLIWQTSDLIEAHPGIRQWITDSELENVLHPLALNVSENKWPSARFDAIFSANSFHIMGKSNVEDFFKNAANTLNNQAIVMIYGPFNYRGQFTSDSNARFDQWLKQRDPNSGIKDFEWCNQLAQQAELSLLDDISMPQNNRLLVWQK
ncbi:DUF938 domain-containing protein [Thiomicrorhabdus sp.]|uniref:DUF938 domain-containing protein n=1 Tax=Thiomicrorhabdus sp. TaxID=2039724 RepID=UPI0029C83251|nr:DUF938 domain-containing protein [Thiomicrorhabdus sp.]